MKTQLMKDQILDAAQWMIQKRGYNGFSYADISETVGIRKASIHYHFATKPLLGVAVVRRYRENFNQHLNNISGKNSFWLDKIQQYGNLYEQVLQEDKLCLCGMLASDMESLPSKLKKEVSLFLTENIDWLEKVLALHYKSFSSQRLNNIAWQIVSTLQGAIMMARMQSDLAIFSSSSKELYVSLKKIK